MVAVMTEKGTNRILEIDVLRGLAALAVVLYHYTLRFHEVYGHTTEMRIFFWPGQYGVNLFFMISGFVIFMTLEKTRHWMDFLVSRFSRLFPAYWMAIAVTFLIVLVSGLPGREVSLQAAEVNFSMLQFLVHVPHVDGVYWTLELELCFYVLMFLLYASHQLQNFEVIAMAWLLLLVALHIANASQWIHIPDTLATMMLLDYGQLFVAGAMFYLVSKHGWSSSRIAILLTCIFFQYLASDIEAALVTAFFMIIFVLMIGGRLRALAVAPLVYLGTVSYSLYLVHQNVGYVALRWLYRQGVHPYLGILFALFAVLSLASVVTFFVEKPSLRWIRARYKNFRSTQKHITNS